MSKFVIILRVNVLEVCALVGGIYILHKGVKFLKAQLEEDVEN